MAGVVLAVIAAVGVFAWFTRSTDTTAVAVDEPVAVVEVEIATGDLEIVRHNDSHVRFETRTEDGWVRAARIDHEISGETLRITGDCRGNRFIPAFGCRTDMAVMVPDGVVVRAEANAGAIHVDSLTGDTTLDLNSGKISVADHVGPLDAHTVTGDISVTRLAAESARISSRTGAVDVATVTAPRSLDAESSAGSVSVRLPAGHQYDVEASSRGGDVVIDADVNHSSVYKVRAFSTNGDVAVSAR
jgi:DUF4097 and DUF4098 domain-containing protein YvlB